MKDVVSRCPIEEVMRLLSGRWPTLLLYYLKDGTKRFRTNRHSGFPRRQMCDSWDSRFFDLEFQGWPNATN